jgi:hypothetical protein
MFERFREVRVGPWLGANLEGVSATERPAA